MGNSANTPRELFPDFQKFLLERKLAHEKNIPYFAYWVSRYHNFMSKLDREALLFDEASVIEFLDSLQADNRIQDWQRRQADDSLRLYYLHYLGQAATRRAVDAATMDAKGVLSEMERLVRIKHYSISTEKTYLHWASRFLHYVQDTKGATADTVSTEDFRDFISHLALKLRVSASTQNQAFNAILFLFRQVLGKEVADLGNSVRAKQGQKLPAVFTTEEVRQIFQHMTGKNLLIAELLYGSGMRLMELARLRVKDIDFEMNTIFVRSGKGDKDRSTVLPSSVKNRLREHLKDVKVLHDQDLTAGHGEVFLPDALGRKYPNAGKEWAWQYVFPSSIMSADPRTGRIARHHISDKSIQEALKHALRKAGIAKHASVHTLRHSFATHLIQSGVNIREVQSLLGHKNVETTMVYTHVLRNMANAPKSPLDSLYQKD